MRGFLQFVGCAGTSLSALIVAGSFLIGTPSQASTALPDAPDCTVCNCTQLQKTCTSGSYKGCSTLCTVCKLYITGSKCETA